MNPGILTNGGHNENSRPLVDEEDSGIKTVNWTIDIAMMHSVDEPTM